MIFSPIYLIPGIAGIVIIFILLNKKSTPSNAQEFIETDDTSNKKPKHTQSIKHPELITIYLVANKPIDGSELLEFLLSHTLQFNAQKIFSLNAQHGSQFHIASLSSPGFFDLKTITTQTFSGLSFFIQPASSSEPVADFDAMCNVLFDAKDRFNAALQSDEQEHIDLNTLREWREQLDHALLD